MYSVTTTITTVGYGEISSKLISEFGFVIALQFLGILMFSLLVGTFVKLEFEQDFVTILKAKVNFRILMHYRKLKSLIISFKLTNKLMTPISERASMKEPKIHSKRALWKGLCKI